jgi:hypothetical protein
MISAQQLDALDPQTRQAVQSLLAQVQQRDAEIAFKQALIDKLTHEMAVLKRLKFAATSERFASTLAPEQRSLLEETLDADLAELAQEIERERGKAGDKDKTDKKTPKRTPLPPHLPRHDVAHEPTDTNCQAPGCGQAMQRIGQDVAEKLDYQPGVFTVERHVRGKWACRCCQKLVQALAEELRRHAVLHADETPVAMLKPKNLRDGKTHKAYIWTYCTTSANQTKAVVFEFSETRAGENVREFLKLDTPQAWQGTLVTDGFSGYNATTAKGATSAQCMAHARRKFNDLWANHRSEVGRKALRYHQCLFRIERETEQLPSDERQRIRQRKSRRVLAVFRRWLLAQRQLVPPGSATMKTIDYSLKRWKELTRFLDDGDVPISNNWVENHIRPIALGRSNWLFAGSLRAGKRAAAIMSLLHSARIYAHDPYAYFKDVLERLPTHPANRIDELLPHRWSPAS